eukprot:jgi/Botrbrau1/6363/Bobra.0098s0022.1
MSLCLLTTFSRLSRIAYFLVHCVHHRRFKVLISRCTFQLDIQSFGRSSSGCPVLSIRIFPVRIGAENECKDFQPVFFWEVTQQRSTELRACSGQIPVRDLDMQNEGSHEERRRFRGDPHGSCCSGSTCSLPLEGVLGSGSRTRNTFSKEQRQACRVSPTFEGTAAQSAQQMLIRACTRLVHVGG